MASGGLSVATSPRIGDSSSPSGYQCVDTVVSSLSHSRKSHRNRSKSSLSVSFFAAYKSDQNKASPSIVSQSQSKSHLITSYPSSRPLNQTSSKLTEIQSNFKKRFESNHRKRRHSFGANDKQFKKSRRRYDGIVLPTKFLLGGNINDPLNLSSISLDHQQSTPYSSPIPTPKHTHEVEVFIPANVNDPLNLDNDDNQDPSLTSPITKAKSRNRKRRRKESESSVSELVDAMANEAVVNVGETKDATNNDKSSQESLPSSVSEEKLTEKDKLSPNKHIEQHQQQQQQHAQSSSLSLSLSSISCNKNNMMDKIVSPAIRQTPVNRHFRKFDNNYQQSVKSDEKTSSGNSHGNQKPHQRHKSNSRNKRKKGIEPRFREKDVRFQYGNYNRYYGYRNPHHQLDCRLESFKSDWFEGKDVLDLGCNTGHVTLAIAKEFRPNKIIGLDIDESLVKIARKNVKHYLSVDLSHTEEFPISLPLYHGPLAPIPATSLPSSSNSQTSNDANKFPNNVFFLQSNYVLESDKQLETQEPEFDCILCLSVTKWVHLNWGDEGLKRVFKRMSAQLRPGGILILEAQPWASYKHKKKMTETTFFNFSNIMFKPEQFNAYLLSREVGFIKCELIATPTHSSKGFRRPIYVFTKPSTSLSHARDKNTSTPTSTPTSTLTTSTISTTSTTSTTGQNTNIQTDT